MTFHVIKHLTISKFTGSNPNIKSVSGFRVCSFNKIVQPRRDDIVTEAVYINLWCDFELGIVLYIYIFCIMQTVKNIII